MRSGSNKKRLHDRVGYAALNISEILFHFFHSGYDLVAPPVELIVVVLIFGVGEDMLYCAAYALLSGDLSLEIWHKSLYLGDV